MAYDITKFERGQVWIIRFKESGELHSHEQQKDRPWVILSIGKFNKSAGMITAAPITTRDSIRTPAQVLFTNENDIKNVILCEQIRTFDHKSGAYSFQFIGVLSQEVMEKVDIALSIHLGMHYSSVSLRQLLKDMQSAIDSVNYMHSSEEECQSLHDSTPPVSNYAYETNNIINHEDVSAVESTPQDTNPSSKNRINWTPENCQRFLDDCSTLPMKKVMEKWNISKKSRYYSTKNYVQSLRLKRVKD